MAMMAVWSAHTRIGPARVNIHVANIRTAGTQIIGPRTANMRVAAIHTAATHIANIHIGRMHIAMAPSVSMRSAATVVARTRRPAVQ